MGGRGKENNGGGAEKSLFFPRKKQTQDNRKNELRIG